MTSRLRKCAMTDDYEGVGEVREWIRAYRAAGEIERLFMQADLLQLIGVGLSLVLMAALLVLLGVMVIGACV